MCVHPPISRVIDQDVPSMRFAPSTRASHRRPGGGGDKRTDAGGGPRPFLDGYSTLLRASIPVRDSLLKFEDECRAWVHLLLHASRNALPGSGSWNIPETSPAAIPIIWCQAVLPVRASSCFTVNIDFRRGSCRYSGPVHLPSPARKKAVVGTGAESLRRSRSRI